MFVLQRTYHSSVPYVTLTDVVKKQPITKQPGTGDGINKSGKPSSLLFYNLTSTVRSEHIHGALRSFYGEYFLKWIDDTSAVVTFNDEETMKKAASSISPINDFSVCPLLESDYDKIFSIIKNSNISSPPVDESKNSSGGDSNRNEFDQLELNDEVKNEEIESKQENIEIPDDWTEIEVVDDNNSISNDDVEKKEENE